MPLSFEKLFGMAPTITTFAPGRVNLIGEYTDLVGGSVLPMPLLKGVSINAAPGPSGLNVYSLMHDEMRTLSLAGRATGEWTDYIVGPCQMLQEIGLKVPPMYVGIEADLPPGAGVSSSAALEVAMIRAVLDLLGENMSPIEIAKLARKAENEFCGVACGIMDQMAVSVGQHGRALSLDCEALNFDNLPIPQDWNFAVIHCGEERKLVDGAYNERRHAIRLAEEELGTSLKRQSVEAVEKIADLSVRARARHVVTEEARVAAAVGALRAGDKLAFGTLMNESHASLRDDFEVSTMGLDALVEAARAAGACGARLTGAGFGGCIVALIDGSQKETWWQNVSRACPKAWPVEM